MGSRHTKEVPPPPEVDDAINNNIDTVNEVIKEVVAEPPPERPIGAECMEDEEEEEAKPPEPPALEPPRNVDFSGVEARVDKIHVEGLTRTKDDIVIQSVQELFQATDFAELMTLVHTVRERLGSLGCFRNIGVQIDTSSGEDSTANGVEVTFFVKELTPVVGGVSTTVGSNEGSLVVSVRTPNLWGRGERIQIEYSHGSRRTNNISLSLIKPLRPKYDATLSGTIFQHSSDWPWSGYRCIERGFLADYCFFSRCMWRHNLQYELAWREMGTISKTSAMSVREQNGHTLKSALRHILTIDYRDALIFPTSGLLFKITSELAGLGGDLRFVRNEFYAQENFHLGHDIVLQTNLTAGLISSISNEEVKYGLPDKFYNGGPLSVRGFHTRGFGPRADGGAVGANFMWGAGIHLFTPLPFRPGRGGFGDLLRIHFFGTFGQCNDLNFSEEFKETVKKICTDIRVSAGFGLAMRLGQIAQVEVNYVFPLSTGEGDSTQPGLQFGVGLQFL